MILRQSKTTDHTQVMLLGYDKPLEAKTQADGLHIQFPSLPYTTTLKYAWTYKLVGVV